jgi:hypothetical protein
LSTTALPAYNRRSRHSIVAPGSFIVLSDRIGPTLESTLRVTFAIGALGTGLAMPILIVRAGGRRL